MSVLLCAIKKGNSLLSQIQIHPPSPPPPPPKKKKKKEKFIDIVFGFTWDIFIVPGEIADSDYANFFWGGGGGGGKQYVL